MTQAQASRGNTSPQQRLFANHIITIQAQPGHKAHAATPATIPSRAGTDNRPSQAPQQYAETAREEVTELRHQATA